MLVLTRGKGQGITLYLKNGDEIKVTLVGTKHGKARIGFVAPKSVDIVRDELERHHGGEKGNNTGTDHAHAERADAGDDLAHGVHHAGAGCVRA